MEQKIFLNFAVGPVQIEPEVLALGAQPIPYFRTQEFSALMLGNEQLVLQAIKAPANSRVVFLTGSGTAAMEAALINLFTPKDKVLVINGGTFGKRFSQLCDVYSINHTDIVLPAGAALTEKHLAPFEKKGYTGLLVNLHETSTGVLYDQKLLADFCKRNHLKLLVDAISSFLADDIDMSGLGACAVIAGSQKAMALPPGISLIVLSQEGQDLIKHNKANGYIRTLYFDLENALTNGLRGQTPFTPAVSILIQLNYRFRQLQQEGFDKIIRRTALLASDFRKKIKGLPFQITSQSLSNALTPLTPTHPVSAYTIFELLKDRYHIFVCPNGGAQKDTLFRVGHIGNLTVQDNDRLLEALADLNTKNLI
ncbi:MAG: alanine--glyoxylate aminotransferase family protein [Elusimicrobiaceae bacterium]|nr:alanine--glyoxylate aminotransferase family protein [Elusimicrobiaceae bacterium]